MAFQDGAEHIRVDDGHILCAVMSSPDGCMVESTLDLNSCLGNNNGIFEWGGYGFANNAQNVRFAIEGCTSVPVLRASLLSGCGDWVESDVNLGERIKNLGGNLVFE